MPKVIFYIRNSKITNPKVIRGMFDNLKDGKYSLDITAEGKRSLLQNAYLHSCIIPMVYEGLKDAGYDDVRDLHDAKQVIKALFLKKKIINKETGEVITETIKDTHDLSTQEMILFIDEVIQWGSTFLNISIPAPNSQAVIDYSI